MGKTYVDKIQKWLDRIALRREFGQGATEEQMCHLEFWDERAKEKGQNQEVTLFDSVKVRAKCAYADPNVDLGLKLTETMVDGVQVGVEIKRITNSKRKKKAKSKVVNNSEKMKGDTVSKKSGTYPESQHEEIRKILKKEGFGYYVPEEELKGIKSKSKPDGAALNKNNGTGCIVEIKSDDEKPTSSSWRLVQSGDTPPYQNVRNNIKKEEEKKVYKKNVGGHGIIMDGQIPDYKRKYKKKWVFRENDPKTVAFNKGAYVAPQTERSNIKKWAKQSGKKIKTVKADGFDVHIFDI